MIDKTVATLVKITRYEGKTGEGISLESAELVRGFGVSGDYYAGNAERQVSLLSQEARDFIEARKNEGLCFGRFKENLTYCGYLPNALTKGTLIAIGGAVIKVSAKKRCFPGCTLNKKAGPCLLLAHGKFANVVTGGNVRVGDTIKITEVK